MKNSTMIWADKSPKTFYVIADEVQKHIYIHIKRLIQLFSKHYNLYWSYTI